MVFRIQCPVEMFSQRIWENLCINSIQNMGNIANIIACKPLRSGRRNDSTLINPISIKILEFKLEINIIIWDIYSLSLSANTFQGIQTLLYQGFCGYSRQPSRILPSQFKFNTIIHESSPIYNTIHILLHVARTYSHTYILRTLL